jgi:hypothetical protein
LASLLWLPGPLSAKEVSDGKSLGKMCLMRHMPSEGTERAERFYRLRRGLQTVFSLIIGVFLE